MELNAQTVINFLGDYNKFTERALDASIQVFKKSMESLFSEVQRIDAESKEQNKKDSNEFCFFDLFNIDENKMSDILAFLLDPEGRHGQGRLYLEEFCKWLSITPVNYADVKVIRERENRIDILLKISDTYVIIENKYRGAQDQQSQLERYYIYVRDCLGVTPDKIYVMYMTQDGTRPSDISLKDEAIRKEVGNRLKLVSFREKYQGVSEEEVLKLIPFFEKCKAKTNLKMCFFLNELTTHIKAEDEKMKKFDKKIFEWLMEDESRTECAYEIWRLFGDYSKELRLAFIKELEKEIRKAFPEIGENWIVDRKDADDEAVLEAYAEIKIFKESWGGYRIALGGDEANFKKVYYGLAAQQERPTLFENESKIRLSLNKLIASSQELDKANKSGFIWFRHFKTNFAKDSDLAMLLPKNRGDLIKTWIFDLKELAECIDKKTNIKIEDLVNAASQ